MKKFILISIIALTLTGCTTIKQYWPKNHDSVMLSELVDLSLATEAIDCEFPLWSALEYSSLHLARYAAWRNDPQATNLDGLAKLINKLGQGGTRSFCELGRKLALQRIEVIKDVWSQR